LTLTGQVFDFHVTLLNVSLYGQNEQEGIMWRAFSMYLQILLPKSYYLKAGKVQRVQVKILGVWGILLR